MAGHASVTSSRNVTRADDEPTETGGGPRRQALCVAYFFPPLGGVSVTRMVSFVRHLPVAGWEPVVLSPRGSAYPLRDPSGMAAVPPAVQVTRALSPEPQAARHLVRAIRTRVTAPLRSLGRIAGRRPARGTVSDPLSEPAAVADRATATPPRNMLASIRRWLFFPDDQLLWLPFAVRAGLRIHRERRLAVIYSTASPVSGHLVAGTLHRLTGLPWVAEFRDPWIGNVLADPLPWTHRRLQRRLERWIVASAARIVFLSAETEAAYLGRYPALAGRSVVVPNGYDAEDLGPPPERPPASTPLRLVYTCTLDRPAETAALMAGLASLVARRPEVSARLAIKFIGHTSPEVAAIVEPYLDTPSLQAMIRFTGFAPRAEALSLVRDADACLVMLGEEPGMSQFVPGKLFDYIGLDAPVLALVPPGEVRSLLERLEWGIVADPTPAGAADGLERLLAGDYRTGRADRAGLYERRGIALQLGSVLDAAATVGR